MRQQVVLDPGALVQDGVEEQQAEVCATGEIRVIGPAIGRALDVAPPAARRLRCRR